MASFWLAVAMVILAVHPAICVDSSAAQEQLGILSTTSAVGSCGYPLDNATETSSGIFSGSINEDNPLIADLPGKGCGICLKITCNVVGNQAACKPGAAPIILVITDSCPSCQLNTGLQGFLQIADSYLGSVNVLPEVVECPARGDMVASISKYRSEQAGGSYVQFTIANARGSGAFTDVELRSSDSDDQEDWLPMNNTYGAAWDASQLPPFPLDIRMTNTLDQTIIAKGVLPEDPAGNIGLGINFPPGAKPTIEPPVPVGAGRGNGTRPAQQVDRPPKPAYSRRLLQIGLYPGLSLDDLLAAIFGNAPVVPLPFSPPPPVIPVLPAAPALPPLQVVSELPGVPAALPLITTPSLPPPVVISPTPVPTPVPANPPPASSPPPPIPLMPPPAPQPQATPLPPSTNVPPPAPSPSENLTAPEPAAVPETPTPTSAALAPPVSSPPAPSQENLTTAAEPAAAPSPSGSLEIAPSAAPGAACQTVTDVISKSPSLSAFYKVLQNTGYTNSLDSEAVNVTVFAPVNNAFTSPVLKGTLVGEQNNVSTINDLVAADPSSANPLIGYHIIKAPLSASQLTPGQVINTTDTLKQFGTPDRTLAISIPGADEIQGIGSLAKILKPDVQACGPSYIQVVDHVLLPFAPNANGSTSPSAAPPTPAVQPVTG